MEPRRQAETQRNSVANVNTPFSGRAAGGADSGGGFIPQEAIPPNLVSNAPPLETSERAIRLRMEQQSPFNREPEAASPLPTSHSYSIGHAQFQSGAHGRMGTSNAPYPTSLNTPDHGDVDLSAELTSMLWRSSFDPELSAIGSNVVGDASLSAAGYPPTPFSGCEDGRHRSAERQVCAYRKGCVMPSSSCLIDLTYSIRQYRLLERYHAQLASQRHPHISQSLVEIGSRARTNNRESLQTTPEEDQFDGRHSLT